MSDMDDDVVELGQRTLRTAHLDPLRQRMHAVVAEHDQAIDLQELRRETSDGTTLSDLVNAGRSERV